MPRQPSQVRRRTRIARGVYRDQWGLAAVVKIGGRRVERRFPAGTPLKTIKTWRDDTRVSLRRASGRANPGTFADDAERYLLTVSAMPTFRERQAHIGLWVREFGQRRRDSIRTSEIDAVLSRWLAQGLAASTVKHRRGALLHLWNRLDGPDAPNPVRRSNHPERA